MPEAPDQSQALLALQQYTSQRGGEAGAHIGGILPSVWDVSGQLSLKGKAFNADAKIVKITPRKPGPLGKGLKSLGFNSAEIFEALKKVAQAGAVQQASHADLFGQSGPTGSSFTNMVGGSRGGNTEIGQ